MERTIIIDKEIAMALLEIRVFMDNWSYKIVMVLVNDQLKGIEYI